MITEQDIIDEAVDICKLSKYRRYRNIHINCNDKLIHIEYDDIVIDLVEEHKSIFGIKLFTKMVLQNEYNKQKRHNIYIKLRRL